MPLYALTMFAAGIGIPILAALNAGLGRHLGAPMVAGLVLFGVAFITALVVAITTGIGPMTKLATAPKHLLLGGVLIAFYVLSITAIAPHFGVGNAVMFVLLGQLVSAAAIDHFGLFGAQVAHLTLTRAAGITLMVAGVVLAQKG